MCRLGQNLLFRVNRKLLVTTIPYCFRWTQLHSGQWFANITFKQVLKYTEFLLTNWMIAWPTNQSTDGNQLTDALNQAHKSTMIKATSFNLDISFSPRHPFSPIRATIATMCASWTFPLSHKCCGVCDYINIHVLIRQQYSCVPPLINIHVVKSYYSNELSMWWIQVVYSETSIIWTNWGKRVFG